MGDEPRSTTGHEIKVTKRPIRSTNATSNFSDVDDSASPRSRLEQRSDGRPATLPVALSKDEMRAGVASSVHRIKDISQCFPIGPRKRRPPARADRAMAAEQHGGGEKNEKQGSGDHQSERIRALVILPCGRRAASRAGLRPAASGSYRRPAPCPGRPPGSSLPTSSPTSSPAAMPHQSSGSLALAIKNLLELYRN